jgi:hypothetical protein
MDWAGAAGPYLGTMLWLWLGVLDNIQGVGLGMLLLQTLSRLHGQFRLSLPQSSLKHDLTSCCDSLARAQWLQASWSASLSDQWS